jgi:putative flippase GtrA
MAMVPAPPTEYPRGAPDTDIGRAGPLVRVVRDQRVAFLLVGGINTLLGLLWFVFFHLTVGPLAGYMVTLLCAHVAAVLCAFVLHRRLVFRVRGQVWLDLARFELVNLSALAINAALLPIAVELVRLAVLPAQLLVTGVTVVLSFFAHRGFSFYRREHRATGWPHEDKS